MSGIDRKFGLPIGTSTNATLRPEPRGEQLIADLLQVPAHVIWPSRYDTRATLQRVLAAKNANKASVASGAITGGGALPIEGINSMTALAVVAGVIVAGIALGWAYRNRGRLFGIRAKITNGEA